MRLNYHLHNRRHPKKTIIHFLHFLAPTFLAAEGPRFSLRAMSLTLSSLIDLRTSIELSVEQSSTTTISISLDVVEASTLVIHFSIYLDLLYKGIIKLIITILVLA